MKNLKSKYAQWATLGSNWKQPTRAILVIRSLPGFDALAARIRIYSPTRANQPWPLFVEEAANQFTRRHFGIARKDVEFQWPDEDDLGVDWPQVERLAEAHEAHFVGRRMNDEEKIAHFLKLSIDARDERGNPMQGLALLSDQLEAVAKGIAGKWPDQASISAERFGENIAAEAAAFLARRRRG